ncbi:DUF6939 family protein [Ktedonobacter robiniae]|uniref:Uncharacterized protein n=1 Tax=Ktedonobacter robiniae TaxID=2778365 RepID=A0ABQ3V3Q1_9CHLR|nr:hypothetical protein [Ktedonobacter robiniae]GHO59553.1 hypothetical protein KSB_80280 [Ktedonobacter robiniae]
MTVFVESHRLTAETIKRRHGEAQVIDVTSRGADPWVRFSPFYPHGDIPVPFSPGYTSQSVEGVWQGLKVFELAGVDIGKFRVANMKGIKRSGRSLGSVLGHREGVDGKRLLGYREARSAIYLPTYRWVLENKLQPELDTLRQLSAQASVILLDYEINANIDDLRRPISHAALIKAYLENNWPE